MKGIHRRAPKRGPIVARRGIALGLAMVLLTAGLAYADELRVDGDDLTPFVSGAAMDLGPVCLGQQESAVALFVIERTTSGAPNIFASESVVTLGAGSSSVLQLVSAPASDATIDLPVGWALQGTGAFSPDTAAAIVTVTSSGAPGARSGSIAYTASGVNAHNGNAMSRTATLTVVWTVAVCDNTPPVIVPTITGTQGLAGWYTGNAELTWSVTDAQSAVSSTTQCGPTTVSADTVGTTFTCTATSAGGSSSQSVIIKRDATAPVISGVASPLTVNGWNTGDVTVTFSCSDAASGIASCTAPVTVSDEGESQERTGTATDVAGNAASSTVSGINIDRTAPTISGAASAANSYGWYKGNVDITFSCDDALSGVATCGPNVTVSNEGESQERTGTATDVAGNAASVTVSGINIDMTKPVTEVTGVVNGAEYVLGSVPAAGCVSTDGLSGVHDEATLLIEGSVVGMFTATCSGAKDLAGNTAADASAEFRVVYAFDGFFRPIDMSKPNVVKAGSAVPVKFSLGGYQGMDVFADNYPKVTMTSACGGGASYTLLTDETVTMSNSGLSYDAANDQYNYVWKTAKTMTGCRLLTVVLADGTPQTALFQFTK